MQKRTTHPNKFQKIEFLEWFFKNIYVTNEVRWNLRGNHEKQPRCEQYQAIENPVQVPSFVRLCVCACVCWCGKKVQRAERKKLMKDSWFPHFRGAAGGRCLSRRAPRYQLRVGECASGGGKSFVNAKKWEKKSLRPNRNSRKKNKNKTGDPKSITQTRLVAKKKANNQLPPEKSQYQSVKDTFKTNETNHKLKLDNVGYKQVENLYPTLNHSMNPNSNKNIQ